MERKELKKAYKESKRPMGIYVIKNNLNDTIYLGFSTDINAKLNRHRAQLKFHSHPVKELQKIWSQNGESSIEFETIDLLEHEEAETDYLEELKVLVDMWSKKLESQGKTIISFKNG